MAKVENCEGNQKFNVTDNDITPSDNAFHCPIVGKWVELKKNTEGKIVCTDEKCRYANNALLK